MDGLECSEVWLSVCENIIDFRIDANTYKKDYVNTSKKLEDLHSHTIESQMKSIQNFGAYSLCNEINFVEQGIPFLVTQNIRHNYIDWNNIKYIDEKSHKILNKSHCHKNQVLVTMAGEYLGRVAVYDVGFISSSNQAIAKITFRADRNPYFISTFLNTKYGQNQINRLKTITGQPNINMGLIKSLLIPPVSHIFADDIERIVRQSTECLQSSKQICVQAEVMLLNELGMADIKPQLEKVAVKSFSDSFGTSGRLDAEYYQTKYDTLFEKLSSVKTYLLGDLVWIKKSVEPGSNEYRSQGIPFVRVSDLSQYGLSEPEIHLSRIPFAHMNLQPKKNTILLSKDGSVGIAYKAEKDLDIVTSGAILHLELKTNQFLPDYLTLVLNSLIVKMQAERDAGGSIIQHWKPSEIEEVVIPWLPINKQAQISHKIQESFSLRRESKELLERAMQAVEMAIEKDEQTAMDWLSNPK